MTTANTPRPLRILLTGVNGQVGGALGRDLLPLGEVYAPGRAELDLTEPDSIRAAVRSFRPDWIVNPAAYTAVDKAESEPELARAVNAIAPAVFAEEAAPQAIPVVHLSTDYVFDGTKPEPYVEEDSTCPANVYGATKREGELALAAAATPYFVFRTSWVYGAIGKNFLRTILRAAREREHLRIVGDQHGAPTAADDLSAMVLHVIRTREAAAAHLGCSVAEAVTAVEGIYHATGAGATTWFGFAEAGIEHLRAIDPEARLATIEAISTSEYPTPARRPLNSRLDCSRLARDLGWSMPPWRESLARVMDRMERAATAAG